ncbi:hypothetical protein EMCRGX_G009216 [Ephydatia muelleri]
MLTHTGERPHQCEQCGKAFSRQQHLKLHRLTHTGERPHQCEQCGKAFSLQETLKRHMLTHTGERSHQCEQCGKAFSRQQHLKLHMLTHTGERPHQCEQCGKAFSLQRNLKCHMLTHTGERSHQCEQCGKAFSRQQHLKLHMLTHTGERPHQCEQCGKAFSQQNTLKCHMLTHTGEKPHQCEQCGKAFSQQNTLKCHMLTHTGEKPHQCEQCGKAFSQQQHLKRHMLTHTGERPHQCEQCGKTFSQQNTLKCHMLTHTGEKPHQCEQCGKAFSQQNTLKCHMLTHTGERPHQCEQCGKAFSLQRNLKCHMLTHTGEKPHQCEQCGKAFSLQRNLKCHMLTHTGEKPHQCEQCGKAFSLQRNLKCHMLTHTGEKPHQCEQCGKAFSLQRNLKCHMLTHTGEKPHQCEQCGKAFSLQRNLKRHMLTHTGERLHQCEQCGKTFSRRGNLKAHMLTHNQEKMYKCFCQRSFTYPCTLKAHCRIHTGERFRCTSATDLVQVLQKLSKISKSKKSHRPQDTLRSVNSPVQKKVPKFQLPIRARIFEEEEHNPLETNASEHAPILQLFSRLAPTPPQTKKTFFPSSAAWPTKRNDAFMRKEKMEQDPFLLPLPSTPSLSLSPAQQPKYKNMVVGGHLPVTLEKAIYLSALQLHIETVLQDSGEALSPVATNGGSSLARSSRITLKSRQTLPAVYTKAKNVTKRVSAQMAEFEELSERNAKHRYIEKCQQCPGYNCAFFNVRVPSAGRYIKGSVAKQLMGISNQNLVFLDEKSKELVGQYSLQDLGGFIHDKSDPCIFTLKIKDFSLKVQVETSTMAWEIQNMLEPSHDVHFLNGQDDLDEWAELDTQTFAMEPPKDSASSPSSAESGELVQDASAVSPVNTPPDPNITTTSLSTSHTTNGHMEGEGLSRENSEDNGPISDPSPAMFCNCPPDPALPRTMDLQNLKLKEVLKCTEEVARQMTLIDHAQLCKISALELLQKVNMVPRPQSQRNSKMSGQSLQSSLSLSSLEQSETAIEKLAFRFNQVGNWVAHCILQHRELDERVTAIHQFILIAKQCLEFNNYSSVMAVVVAGLGSAPIRRLHKTWEGVSKYHVDLFKEMDLLLESGNNYKRYRDRLSTIPTPAVPYIGVFLKDLTFICDGNPDYLRGRLINVHKRRQVYSKVEEIKRLQRDAYNFQPVLELQNYFTQYRLTPDDELHSLSHELEPKMVVHRRATRSRSSTNLSSTTPNFSFFKPNSKHLSTTTLRT